MSDGKEAVVISGRLLRSLHRLRNKKLRWFQRAISRTKEGSRRRRKLLDAKYRFLNNIDRRIEHVLHAISAEAVRWCMDRKITTVYVGDPSGVREKNCGRKHNQRLNTYLRRVVDAHGSGLLTARSKCSSGGNVRPCLQVQFSDEMRN